jgi:hypothetical protein
MSYLLHPSLVQCTVLDWLACQHVPCDCSVCHHQNVLSLLVLLIPCLVTMTVLVSCPRPRLFIPSHMPALPRSVLLHVSVGSCTAITCPYKPRPIIHITHTIESVAINSIASPVFTTCTMVLLLPSRTFALLSLLPLPVSLLLTVGAAMC